MTKFSRWLLCAIGLLIPIASFGQQTQVTATNIKMGGLLVSTGYVTFTPVGLNGVPTAFADGSGAQNGPTAFECGITAGAITGALQENGTFSGTCFVPDATQTVPANILYQIQVVDNSTGLVTSNKAYTLQSVVGVSGATWALDHYGPAVQTTNVQTIQIAQGSSTPTKCVSPYFFVNTTTQVTNVCINGVYVPLSSGTGTQGPAGPAGANGIVNYRNAFSPTIASGAGYAIGDGVSYTPSGGFITLYVSKVNANASVPGADGNWVAIADGPGAASSVQTPSVFTVGATSVTAATLGQVDTNGNVIPATAFTPSTLLQYAGVVLASNTTGNKVGTISGGGIAPLTLDGTNNFINDIIVQSTINPQWGHDSGTAIKKSLPDGTLIIGTLQNFTGTAGMVITASRGDAGSGSTVTSPYLQNTFSVTAYSVPAAVGGYVADSTTVIGTGDGTTRVFNAPYNAAAFNYYVASTLTTAYTTSGLQVTFTTAPGAGASVAIRATATDLAVADANTFITVNGGFSQHNGATVVLSRGYNWLCKDAILAGNSATSNTVSILGWGSQSTAYAKELGCGASLATLAHQALLGSAVFQGFTVDSGGIDDHAIDTDTYVQTMYTDIAARAPAGTSYNWGIGNHSASNYQIALINDTVYGSSQHAGKNNPVTLTWTGTGVATGVLNVVTTGANDAVYSQYAVIEMGGAGLLECTTAPVLTPVLTPNGTSQSELGLTYTYSTITAITVTTPGVCSAKAQADGIYASVFDNQLNYGLYVINMTDSNMDTFQAYGGYKIAAELFGANSGNNHMIKEHQWSASWAGIIDQAGGNTHVADESDSHSFWAAVIDNSSGSFTGMTMSWDTNAYYGANGILNRNLYAAPVAWTLSKITCPQELSVRNHTEFSMYANRFGPISTTNPIDNGVEIDDSIVCDGTGRYIAKISANNAVTSDLVNYGYDLGDGTYFGTSQIASKTLGVHRDTNYGHLYFRNNTSTSSTWFDPDPLGIAPDSAPEVSAPFHGALATMALATPAAPIVGQVGTLGSQVYQYACAAFDTFGQETLLGPAATLSTGFTTLDPTNNYNTVGCVPVSGYHGFFACLVADGQTTPRAAGYLGQLTKATTEKYPTGAYYMKDVGTATSTLHCQSLTNYTGGFGVMNGNNFVDFVPDAQPTTKNTNFYKHGPNGAFINLGYTVSAPMVGSALTLTGLPGGMLGCFAKDLTTAAGVINVSYASGTATITAGTGAGATDNVLLLCTF